MDISSLSLPEVVSIVATYQSFTSKEEPDFSGRGYTEAQIAAMRKAKKETSSEIKSLNFKFTKSVKEFPCSNFEYFITLFGPYSKNGVLPYPGSLTEQPNKIIEVFNILKALNNETEEKIRKEIERKKPKAKG